MEFQTEPKTQEFGSKYNKRRTMLAYRGTSWSRCSSIANLCGRYINRIARLRVEKIKYGLQEDFEIQDLGLAERCFGLEIIQSKGKIVLTQKSYIVDMLQQFDMQQCNPAFTPAECGSGLADKETSASDIEERPYRELIGALLYQSTTRPDIANTAARLAQFTSASNSSHWVVAKRVLRYLAHTSQIGLIYSQNKELILGYSDWGENLID